MNQEQENRTEEENTTELLRLKGAIVFPSTRVHLTTHFLSKPATRKYTEVYTATSGNT